MNTTSFSIENAINPSTGKQFGSEYSGTFTVRRPSMLDKKTISVKDAASMSLAGKVNRELIGEGTRLLSYIFCFVETIAEEPLPAWFNMGTMYDPIDEDAVLAVWEEVNNFVNSFRPKADR